MIQIATKSLRGKWAGPSCWMAATGRRKSTHCWRKTRRRKRRDAEPDSFEEHSLYRAAFALTVWIDHMFDQDATLQNEPSAVKLATHAALASAKLAAALSGEDVDEIGMTIAYLKRALKAITLSMDAAAALLREKRIAAIPACGPFAAPFPGARRDYYANRANTAASGAGASAPKAFGVE